MERAFGYKNSQSKYVLVAATLSDETGEIFLVGATEHNYGNTAELNVMNYKQAMSTVDKEEWNKSIKVEHDKIVKYNVFNQLSLIYSTSMWDDKWCYSFYGWMTDVW